MAPPRWLTPALAVAASLCLAVAGQHAASGRLQPSTGFVVGFVVGLLAMLGLTSVSSRLVARVLLVVSAVSLVRLGLISGSIATGGQTLLVWLVAAVFVLVLSDRAGTELRSPLARPSSEPEGRAGASRSAWATVRSGAIVAGLVVLVAIVLAPVLLPYVGKAVEPGQGATLDPTGRDSSVVRATDSLDMTRRPELTDEVVFTVETDRATFWRGQTFDVWDGRRWTRSDGRFVPLASYDTPQLGADDLSATGTDVVEQRFRIEAPYSDVVYAVPTAVRVQIDRPVRQRADGTLFSAPLGRGATYSVTSRRTPLTAERLRTVRGAIPATVADQYAQPPQTTDRVRAAATEITAGSTTQYDKVLALEKWMGDRVEYSLDAPRAPTGVDVVDHFLFDAEQGWCEQIASSLVVLARANGIPARLVTGYVPGDHDPVTGRFTVRQRDAHAWAEVWFPEVGWVPFDPTADVPLAGADQSEPTIAEWLQQHLVLIGLVIAAVVLLVGPVRIFVRRIRARRSARPVGWAATADRRLDRLGARVDRPRGGHETASAYAAVLAERYRDERLAAAGAAIDRALYASRAPSPATEADLDALLDELAAAEIPVAAPAPAPAAEPAPVATG
jgi:transglutaminase-like putative cysteine protease